MEIPYVPSPNNILSIMQWKKVVQPVSVLYGWIVVDSWESRKPSATKTGKPPNSSSSRQSFYPDLRRFIKKAWWRDSAHDHQLNHAQAIEHTVVRLLDSQTECWLWASWAFKSGVLFFSKNDNWKCPVAGATEPGWKNQPTKKHQKPIYIKALNHKKITHLKVFAGLKR